MATTYKVVGGKLEIKETQPPKIMRIGPQQFDRRVDRLNARIELITAQIAVLESQKANAEATLAELTPYIGQL